MKFFYTFDDAIRKKFNARLNSIWVYKKFDELKNEFYENVNKNTFDNFILRYTFPAAMPFDARAHGKAFGLKKRPTAYLFTDNSPKG